MATAEGPEVGKGTREHSFRAAGARWGAGVRSEGSTRGSRPEGRPCPVNNTVNKARARARSRAFACATASRSPAARCGSDAWSASERGRAPARAECAGGSRARGGGLRIYCPWTVLSWCTSARGRPGKTCAAGLSLPNSGPVGPGAKCEEACGAQERRRRQGEGGIVCTHR